MKVIEIYPEKSNGEMRKRWDTNLMSDLSWNSSCSIQMRTIADHAVHMKSAGYFDLGPLDLGENARDGYGVDAGRYGI